MACISPHRAKLEFFLIPKRGIVQAILEASLSPCSELQDVILARSET
jgi:hypothetical protein